MEPGNKLIIDSLPEEWRDKDSVLLHACFQLLKDFVEKEDVGGSRNDWCSSERRIAAKAEIDELYTWWESYPKKDHVFIDDEYELQNTMLIRLINIRWALST